MHQVILLPGSVLPAEPAYASLLTALGDGVDARPKDLELYAGVAPPVGYSLAMEVDGVARVAEAAAFDRFHLVGYSGGGAASLAFAAAVPERLLSLALLEPAFAGWQRMSDRERTHFEGAHQFIQAKDDADLFAQFQAFQLAPGVAPPSPPPESAPWMATRPAGIRVLIELFLTSDLDLHALETFTKPVLFVLGGRSHPDYFAAMAERLARVFPDFRIEVFPERHHFDPPHRIEPERLAPMLRTLWERGEASASTAVP